MIHSTHNIIYRQEMPAGACSLCSKCACHDPKALEIQCESVPVADVPIFKGELPIFYQHGLMVNGKAEGVRKPDGAVVITITLLENEDAKKILAMLEGGIPLALSWTLRQTEPKWPDYDR